MTADVKSTDFENWQINLDLFCLQDELGNEIFMQPRLLKLLSILSENSNQVVSRIDLIDLVWDDVIVSEDSLSKATFDLRNFLNERFANPPDIETIRKVGYRLKPGKKTSKGSVKTKVLTILKIVAYLVVIGIIIILVIRGLNY